MRWNKITLPGWEQLQVEFDNEDHQLWWNRLSPRERARWLTGHLWNCTDILPDFVRSDVHDEFERDVLTYGQLVRLLAEDLRQSAE
jgi:hypothetical protein